MGSKAPIRPPKLVAGSRVALIAPAGPLLERDDLARAEALCRELGWTPRLGAHAGRHHGYFAGTDDERLADLNAALSDPEVDAVWCIRGGFGVTRYLDRVDFDAFARRPKAVIGFSDVTALILALYARTAVVTFHGPMARQAMGPFNRDHFERALAAPAPAGRLGRLPQPDGVLLAHQNRIVTLTGGVAEGPLVGGNLTLLQALVGTPWLPSLDGAILFLEDVGEEVYRIDRMLAHLRLAGVLGRVAGVLVGRFTEMERRGADGAMGFDQVLAAHLEPLRVPVAYGFPVGHVDEQWTLPIGVRARLDASAGEVEILEPAVR
jgi:muramoyltetrapeptide carboxypeptidase